MYSYIYIYIILEVYLNDQYSRTRAAKASRIRDGQKRDHCASIAQTLRKHCAMLAHSTPLSQAARHMTSLHDEHHEGCHDGRHHE